MIRRLMARRHLRRLQRVYGTVGARWFYFAEALQRAEDRARG